MARWTRAAKVLQLPPGSQVLDLGCAFGFGTRYLARRYRTYGHDLSETYVQRARSLLPAAIFTCGPADRVPYGDAFFDAVVMLDVLEHVPSPEAVLEEVGRILRPGGMLVISVPNRGFLSRLDSLNLYHRLFGYRRPFPTDDPSWPISPVHRHYSLADMHRLLDSRFVLMNVQYTGLGVSETVNLLLLVLLRAFIVLPRVYAAAQYLYFIGYLLEDLIPTPSWGYHMMVLARLR